MLTSTLRIVVKKFKTKILPEELCSKDIESLKKFYIKRFFFKDPT